MVENKSTIRYRIRKKDPSWREHFFPWGLLGLLLVLLPLLYGLFWYAKQGIQNTVQTEIEQELASQDLEWVQVDVDGQAVMLSGQGTKQEGDRAISLARKVKEDAWWGRFSVPSKVDGRFYGVTKIVEEPELKTMIEPVEDVKTSEPTLVWGRLVTKLDSGILTLTGTVGSQAEKVELLEAADSRLDPPRLVEIVDQLEVSDQELTPGSEALAKRTSELISSCNSGQSSSIDGVFSIQCQTTRGEVERLESIAKTPISGATLGQIQISSSDHCNESFAQILEGKSIRFSIGSANLKPASAPLLDKVSELAKSCSGAIRVEGHTDKTGDFDANMALSDARAKAVVQALVARGVQRERLFPEGFGQTKPRVEGDTQVAYALNRRIEFYVSQ